MEKLNTYTAGKSSREVAALFGISQPYLSQLLTGVRTPSLKLALLIEDVSSGAVPVSSWKVGP